ncbi:MAG TPA: hypothetical protein EYG75_01880 [Campylobacterales bacterium]|nr:hypothetical protein [Campylobacterales bacterium]
MAKIKKVSKTTSSKRRKAPILSHSLQKSKIKKHDTKPQHSRREGLTVREHKKALELYRKSYIEGVTIANVLNMSLEVDKKRAREELSALYLKTTAKDIFTFTVKASGKYNINFFGIPKPVIAKQQQVNLKWVIDGVNDNMSHKDIFLNAKIKFECSCGRHTFFYRYSWTVLKSSLGLQQHVFPRKTNGHLTGLVCKHGIRVMQVIHGKAFQRTFARWVDNKKIGKATRVSDKDKIGVSATSIFN